MQQLYEAAQQHKVKVVSAPFKRYVEATNSYKRTRVKEKGIFKFTNKNFASLEYNVFKLYHSSIFEDQDIRFPGRLIHEDVEFYWKVFTIYNCIYCLEQPVMVYRIRASSIMNSKKSDDYCDNNIELIKNIFSFLEKKDLVIAYREAFTREYYHFYYMGSTFDAEKYSRELEPFFRSNKFKLDFSMRRIRKWFFNKKFNQNERTLRLFGMYLLKTKL